MDNDFIQKHRNKICRRFVMRTVNLIKIGNMRDAAEITKRWSVILNLWAEQDAKEQESARKGLERNKAVK